MFSNIITENTSHKTLKCIDQALSKIFKHLSTLFGIMWILMIMVQFALIVNSILFTYLETIVIRNIVFLYLLEVFTRLVKNILVCSHQRFFLVHVQQFYIDKLLTYRVLFVVFLSQSLYLFKKAFMFLFQIFQVLLVPVLFILYPLKFIKMIFSYFLVF